MAKEFPKIAILALGGTIASLAVSRIDEFYSAAQIDIADLVAQLPELNALARIHTEQLSQVISHHMTDTIWLELADKIQTLLAEGYDGVVITQGTHSLEETAYFLNLVIKSSKPIVLTGAMLPSNALGSEGLRNLYNAVLLAAHPGAHQQGVLITFYDKIYAARDFSKCQEHGLLGYICGQNIYFYYRVVSKHTYCSDFSLKNWVRLPKVDIVYGGVGCCEIMISQNTQGIISVGMGKGYQPQDLTDILMSASKQGVVVVRCSRSENMVVTRDSRIDDQYHFIVGNNLSPQKARILLALGLHMTHDVKILQEIFNEY